MTNDLPVLLTRLIIALDLLYDSTKDQVGIWSVLSDIIGEMQQSSHGNRKLAHSEVDLQSLDSSRSSERGRANPQGIAVFPAQGCDFPDDAGSATLRIMNGLMLDEGRMG